MGITLMEIDVVNNNALGLRYDKVELSPYQPVWEELYEQEEEILHTVLDDYILKIEHIGSTSVPGLKAKPIIDIMAAVDDIVEGANCIELLIDLGYRYLGECGRSGRIFFVKQKQKITTHHLHLVEEESKYWRKNLLFRNILRDNEKLAQEYAQVKENLAAKFKLNRDKYREEKAEFINRILTNHY